MLQSGLKNLLNAYDASDCILRKLKYSTGNADPVFNRVNRPVAQWESRTFQALFLMFLMCSISFLPPLRTCSFHFGVLNENE